MRRTPIGREGSRCVASTSLRDQEFERLASENQQVAAFASGKRPFVGE